MTPAQGLLCRSCLLSLHLPVCQTHAASLFISITNLWHCARAKHPKTPSLSQIVTCCGGGFCSGWSREGCSAGITVMVGFLAEERISLGLINEEDGPKWVQRTGSLRPLRACYTPGSRAQASSNCAFHQLLLHFSPGLCVPLPVDFESSPSLFDCNHI